MSNPRPATPPRAEAIAAIQYCAHSCGHSPSPAHWRAASHSPDLTTIFRIFGSFAGAVAAGGRDRPPRPLPPGTDDGIPRVDRSAWEPDARVTFFYRCALGLTCRSATGLPGPGVLRHGNGWLCAHCALALQAQRAVAVSAGSIRERGEPALDDRWTALDRTTNDATSTTAPQA